jgi:hypothetical protein
MRILRLRLPRWPGALVGAALLLPQAALAEQPAAPAPAPAPSPVLAAASAPPATTEAVIAEAKAAQPVHAYPMYGPRTLEPCGAGLL